MSADRKTKVRVCRTCGVSGKVFCARSWFPADGYTSHRCPICKGSGESSFPPTREYARWQAARRTEHGIQGASINAEPAASGNKGERT